MCEAVLGGIRRNKDIEMQKIMMQLRSHAKEGEKHTHTWILDKFCIAKTIFLVLMWLRTNVGFIFWWHT